MFATGVLAGLQRHRAELRQHVAGRRVGDPRGVAGREDLGMVGQPQLRIDRDAIAPLELDAQRLRRAGSPGGPAPQTSVCAVKHRAGCERDARRLDGLDSLAEHDLDAALLELVLCVLADVRLEHREELRAGLDE